MAALAPGLEKESADQKIVFEARLCEHLSDC